MVAVEADERALEHGRGVLQHSTDRAVQRGKLTPEDQAALHAHVRFSTALEDLADRDLVVEAVPERLDLKREIFGKLDSIVSAETILATNTSSLSVTEISVATHNPRRVLGMHFFNPAPVLKFVEVIRTVVTEDAVVEDVRALADRLGKMPVVVGDKAGFIANALLFGYLNHAVSLFESRYASREDIDAAMTLGCGLPMGPLALMDLIGLDTAYEVLDTMYQQGRDRLHAPSPMLRQMSTAGLKGRKTGKGFYTYDEPGSSRVVDDALTPKPVTAQAVSPRPVQSVGIVGSGTMAAGMAEVFARSGFDVIVVARSAEAQARASATVAKSLEKAVQRGKCEPAERDGALARLTWTTRLEDLASVDLAVEAVVEELDVEAGAVREPRRDLPSRRDPGHDDLVPAGDRVRGRDPAPGGRRRPALLQPGPGHAAGRGRPHRHDRTRRPGDSGRRGRPARQARRVVRRPVGVHRQRAAVPLPQRRGQDAAGALRGCRGHRHGDEDRLRLPHGSRSSCSTRSGLDVALAIQRQLYLEFREPGFAPAPLLEQLVTAGYLGRKTGRGFRTYGSSRAAQQPGPPRRPPPAGRGDRRGGRAGSRAGPGRGGAAGDPSGR